LGGLAGCGRSPQPSAVATAKQAVWQEDPWLDEQQKELLSKLTDQSSTPLHVETWARAGVVQRLDLDVLSGAPAGSSLEVHARTFLAEYGQLWKLGESGLDTIATREFDDCSSVTLQRLVDGLPVVNATLRVMLTPDGRVRAVTGRLTGEPFVVDERQANVEDLAERLSAEFGRGEVPPESFKAGATEVVFDPFFSGDSEHDAVRGWMWRGQDPETGATTRVVVASQVTGGVVFAGQLHPIEPATAFVCEDQDPQLWLPEVEYDELSGMPMFVGMGHFGGLKTTGSDDIKRALSVMQFDGVQQLYGDADPASHLDFVETTTGPDGRVAVSFRELWDGVPVEGTWVTVVLSPAKRAERIHSRFVYFPATASQPTIAEPAAQATAVDEYLQAECGSEPTCRLELTAELSQAPVTGRLAVFSGLVFQGTAIPGTSDLAWGYELPRREVWVSATTGLVLGSYARHALDLSMPWDIQNGAPFPAELQIVDGGVVPGVSVDPDVAALNAHVIAMGNFVEAEHPWVGVHGDGGWEHFYVGGKNQPADAGVANQNNAFFCVSPNCIGSLVEGDLMFGRNAIAPDVVAHEWGHGIVYWGVYQNGRGPEWFCEGRSVHEHLADVIGETSFPSAGGAWTLGEDTRMGVIRNMSQPSSVVGGGGLVPFNFWPPSTSPDKCQNEAEVYQYAGPANRAATLIADGFNGRPGIARLALHELYWQMLGPKNGSTSTSVSVLGPSARYRDLVRALHATCVQKRGSTLKGVVISPATCDLVNRAFVEVGFLDRRVFGVTQVTRMFLGDTAYSYTAYSGLRLHRGCTLTNQRLTVVDDVGQVRTSDWNDTPQMTVNYGSEFGVRVTARGSATDPTDRSVVYSVGAKWFGPWRATIYINEDIALGPGVSEESECFAPAGFTARRLVSLAQVNEWAVFLDGNNGTQAINAGVSLPPGCQLPQAAIVGTHWHRDGTTFGDVVHFDHGDHGYTVVPTTPGTYGASVGWWHDGASAIFARVVYDVLEAQGSSCLVPGAVIEVP
jgi:Zn-dependent metalloprotease